MNLPLSLMMIDECYGELCCVKTLDEPASPPLSV